MADTLKLGESSREAANTSQPRPSQPTVPAAPSPTHARFASPSLASITQANARASTSTTAARIWSRLKESFGPPQRSTARTESQDEADLSLAGSVFAGSSGTARSPLDLLNPKGGTASRHKFGRKSSRPTFSRGKSSWAASRSGKDEEEDDEATSEPLSHVVVENDFERFVPPAKSDSGSTANGTKDRSPPKTDTGADGEKRMVQLSDNVDDKASWDELAELRSQGRTARSSMAWVTQSYMYEMVSDRLWPNVRHFFDSSFPEDSKERAFQRESWFTHKQGAIASSAFYLISWILSFALQPHPWTWRTWVAYFIVPGVLTVPIPIFVLLDVPRDCPWLWQPWLLLATWEQSDELVGEMWSCGFFEAHAHCNGKTFLNMMGYAFAQPTLALLAMRQNRAWHSAGAIVWLGLAGGLLIGRSNSPTLFYRNLFQFLLYHVFLIVSSFYRERSDRQMFAMRQQLKIQYRATQSAQVMERRAADSKKRFVSYIFHEVRVPLNTALLAVQNLEGEKVFKGLEEEQAEMVHGLMGSLTMMEKVLNDVLSFNRMESGKFAQAKKPFDFHQSIQLVALSHRMQAHMAGVDLLVDLDRDIDKIGGTFVGDEMRLRQVTSNLVSNAIKFTEQGSVRIVTKLLYPRCEVTPTTEPDDPLHVAAVNRQRQEDIERAERLLRLGSVDNTVVEEGDSGSNPLTVTDSHDPEKGSIELEARRHSRETARIEEEKRARIAVVRVEIHDTGVGLKKADVLDNRLFSPYVQTEIGRRQGGKGSGLGLALVRQIIKLSHGRLGVESQYGKGSMFWFELPYSMPPSPAGEQSNKSRLDSLSTAAPSSPRRELPVGVGRPGLAASRRGSGLPNVGAPLNRIVEINVPNPPSTVVDIGAGLDTEAQTNIEHREGVLDAQAHKINPDRPDVRPGMTLTESTLPLLGSSGSSPGSVRNIRPRGRRMDSKRSIPAEEMIISTYPPVPGSESSGSDENGDVDAGRAGDAEEGSEVTAQRQVDADGTFVDPFSRVPSSPSPLPPNGGAGAVSASSPGGRRTSVETSRVNTAVGAEEQEGPVCALVVDDDKLTRMLMSRMLTRLGHQVTTAENGKVALRMIRASFERAPDSPQFDVVFLDNQMPLMSGVEVARSVRSLGCPIYIVGCTGNALREDQEQYISAGADGIIPKPIHQKAIVDMIAEARKRVRGETHPKELEGY